LPVLKNTKIAATDLLSFHARFVADITNTVNIECNDNVKKTKHTDKHSMQCLINNTVM